MAETTFDYIIVGGGTSGLVLANRLSENPEVKVLVLEAGKSYLGDPRISMPAGWPALLETEADWNFKIIPQVSYESQFCLYSSNYDIRKVSMTA